MKNAYEKENAMNTEETERFLKDLHSLLSNWNQGDADRPITRKPTTRYLTIDFSIHRRKSKVTVDRRRSWALHIEMGPTVVVAKGHLGPHAVDHVETAIRHNANEILWARPES